MRRPIFFGSLTYLISTPGAAMDRSMQERLIGTIVVVALGVLLIPLWLDGPEAPDAAPRDLHESTEVRSQTIRLDADEPQPVVPPPAQIRNALPTPVAEREPAGAPAVAAPSRSSEPEVESRPAADPLTAGEGDWAVQVGSFTSAENARKLAADLEARGFPAFVSPHADGGRRLLRVRVGPAPDRGDAEVLAARLEKAGENAQVVRQP